MHETVENVGIALDSVKGSRSEVHGSVVPASLFKNMKYAEGAERYLVSDELCLSLRQGSELFGGAEAAVPSEPSLATVSGELSVKSGGHQL